LNPVPLKWRISLLVTLVLVAATAVVCSVAYYELGESLRGNIENTLRAMVGGVLASMDDPRGSSGTEAEIRNITGNAALERTGRYRVWMDGSDKDLFASSSRGVADRAWMWQLEGISPPEPGQTVFFDAGRDGREYRVAWSRQGHDGAVVNVLVALSSARVRHEMREFLKVLLIIASAVTAGAVALGVMIVLWSLRPVARTAERLRTITHHDLGSAHLEDLRPPAELRPFVDALGNMLARLDAAMRRQAEFTGDASHELRTPLASAKSTLQAAVSRPRQAEQYRQAIEDTLRDLDRMDRLIRQLLALARMDESDSPGEHQQLRLDELLADLAAAANAANAAGHEPSPRAEKRKAEDEDENEDEDDSCRQGHAPTSYSRLSGTANATKGSVSNAANTAERPRVVCTDMPATTVRGDADELAQLFRNLIDNALVHGPRDGIVTLSISAGEDSSVAAAVHDEGGLIPPEALGRLFDRFYRADPSRASATGGTGLGLAIVREIVRRHHGHVEITSTPATGTTVTVRLPV
jgi:two-component system heavy metal sensor histidine kinase CusS